MESILSGLGSDWAELLKELGRIAYRHNAKAYLIGGPVRDLLLGVPTNDIDVMVEGDALELTRRLYREWQQLFPGLPAPGKPVHFPKFGTAKLRFREPLFGSGTVIDFSTARRETYARPGAQPTVAPGDLASDLARRDFSINAIAIGLAPASLGEIVDPFDGRTHISRRCFAILHERSFEDDPARLIRAVRFMIRLEFELVDATARCFAAAAADGLLRQLPPFRLFDELRKALLEQRWHAVTERLQSEGLLAQVHPKLAPPADAAPKENWQERFAALCIALDAREYRQLLESFALPAATIEQLSAARAGV